MNFTTYLKNSCLLCFIIIVGDGYGQPLKAQTTYTHADTLRGSLRPERTCYDVLHYEIDLRIDTATHSISGSNEIRFGAVTDVERMQIDLTDSMTIDSIMYGSHKLLYTRDGAAIFVKIAPVIHIGTQATIRIYYHGVPHTARNAPWDGGFVWTHDSLGRLWMGVACEGIGLSSWLPCKDHLSDEPDSGMRIHCTVPYSLIFVSNGRFDNEMSYGGLSTFTWTVSYPINSYNITLNLGYYTHFSDEYIAHDGDKLPLEYYVLDYNLARARNQFKQVKPMLSAYEHWFGKYPFWRDGYKLVETPYVGMEHQSAIAYGNRYLTGYTGADFSRIGLTFDYMIIHESGHEWWGNSVSCRDLADMWIHESFCTYAEALYVESMHGYDTALLYINAKKSSVHNRAPIQGPYHVNQEGSGEMYSKGSLFLNTIRSLLHNDERWHSIIKGLADTAFKYKVTDAEEVIHYMTARSGMNIEPILRQYIQHAAIPKLIYSLQKIKGKTYQCTAQWEADVPNFEMDIIVGHGKKIHRYTVGLKPKTFTIKLRGSPSLDIREDLEYIYVVQK